METLAWRVFDHTTHITATNPVSTILKMLNGSLIRGLVFIYSTDCLLCKKKKKEGTFGP